MDRPGPRNRLPAARRGEGSLEWAFGKQTILHFFCSRCGVKTHGFGKVEAFGGPFMSVSIGALDLDPDLLAPIPVVRVDGRNDRSADAPTI